LSADAILPAGRKRARKQIAYIDGSRDDDDDEYEDNKEDEGDDGEGSDEEDSDEEDSDDEPLVDKFQVCRDARKGASAKRRTSLKTESKIASASKIEARKIKTKVTAIKKLLAAAGVPDGCVEVYAQSLVAEGVGTKTAFNRLDEATTRKCGLKKGHMRAVTNMINAEAALKVSDRQVAMKVAAMTKLLSSAGVPDSCVDDYADSLVAEGVGTKTVLTKIERNKLLVRCAVVMFTGLEVNASKTLKKCGIKTGHTRLICRLIAGSKSLDIMGAGAKAKQKDLPSRNKRKRGGDSNGQASSEEPCSDDINGSTYLEYRSGGSNKFWSIRLDGHDSITLFGRRGTHGTKAVKTHTSEAEAQGYASDLIQSKIRKGYSTATAPAALASGWLDAEAAATLKAKHSEADPGSTGSSPYLTCNAGTSNKFWRIRICDVSTISTYGRIGTAGVSAVKEHEDTEEAEAFVAKQIDAKLKKGYDFAVAPGATKPSRNKRQRVASAAKQPRYL
jgi:predicted DNA-binding WGR domain protein